MTAPRELDKIAEMLRSHFSARVLTHGSAVSLGLEMSSGRSVGCYLDETASGMLRVSDGGDAWSDLVSEGYADPSPSSADREKLARACEMHGVMWDPKKREIFGFAKTVAEAAALAAKIATTAISIDGWRAWYPARATSTVTTARILRHLQRLAPHRGWLVDSEIRSIDGGMHRWPVSARLTRDRGTANVRITQEQSAERIMERTVGFLLDVHVGGLVIVLPPKVERFIRRSREFQHRVALVPRLAKGTPRAVVDAADRAVA